MKQSRRSAMTASGRSEPTMRTVSRCLLLALLIAGLGVTLRRAVPVTPVDGAFQAVLRAYAVPQPDHQQHD
ncbi:hypothetical protein SAMN05216360_107177 [Methylobacterium phyllostachyos]|uniref:Uncharacterized protein n=1 Tax=Methylobacterium phyllostachyos TaxID=582672 RepID=A0A1H0AEF0_9HYPH|nr:hypothetical protein [Methylobacterium phyllostachyos]SDN32002.1 hypothetical protein SAMN05216360_107177 [Methylobacterium phyllostachyos]